MKRLLLPVLAVAFIATASTSFADPNEVAKARLEKSSRHLEWITLKHDGRDVKCFIGFPEVKNKATAVVLIHEIFGLSDWMRGMVDEFAEAGYIAIAPDFLSGVGPNGGGTEALGGADGARGKIGSLPQSQIDADVDAAVAYVKKLDACNGKVVVAGFCWGGGKTFLYAVHNPNFQAGLSFYGTPAKPEDMTKIKASIYGFYAERDPRITAMIPAASDAMKAASKFYEPVTYEGAGHGFMRAGDDPAGSAENRKARDDSWKRIKEILAKI